MLHDVNLTVQCDLIFKETATEAIRLTSNRPLEESLDILTQLATAQGYNRVNFGSNASNNNRAQLPPPYNAAVHRISWKGSEESLNSPKRAESPMMGMESAVPLGNPTLKSTG